jgi:hypothetical protein
MELQILNVYTCIYSEHFIQFNQKGTRINSKYWMISDYSEHS